VRRRSEEQHELGRHKLLPLGGTGAHEASRRKPQEEVMRRMPVPATRAGAGSKHGSSG
jgi:hypothetical protein